MCTYQRPRKRDAMPSWTEMQCSSHTMQYERRQGRVCLTKGLRAVAAGSSDSKPNIHQTPSSRPFPCMHHVITMRVVSHAPPTCTSSYYGDLEEGRPNVLSFQPFLSFLPFLPLPLYSFRHPLPLHPDPTGLRSVIFNQLIEPRMLERFSCGYPFLRIIHENLP